MIYTKNKTIKKSKRKFINNNNSLKKRNYILNGGNNKVKQVFNVLENNGVPDNENNMKNQCFWISLLQWIKYNNINYINKYNINTVSDLKKVANEIVLDENTQGNKKVNDNLSSLEIIDSNDDGVYNRLHELAILLDIYIQIFFYNNNTQKIDLSEACKNKGLINEECNALYTFGNLTSQNKIFIVSYGNHFELITKLNEKNFDYQAPISKNHVELKRKNTDDNYYYNNNGELVSWENLSLEKQQVIIEQQKLNEEKKEKFDIKTKLKSYTEQSIYKFEVNTTERHLSFYNQLAFNNDRAYQKNEPNKLGTCKGKAIKNEKKKKHI